MRTIVYTIILKSFPWHGGTICVTFTLYYWEEMSIGQSFENARSFGQQSNGVSFLGALFSIYFACSDSIETVDNYI